jgi:DNA-directed RNA polymerase subunit RPC12/RpoP
MGARTEERERTINLFIIKIFKCKADGLSKPMALIKMKHYLGTNGKKWNANIEKLFENTWVKQVPPEVLKEFKREDREKRVKLFNHPPIRIKPNKIRPRLTVEETEIPDPPKIKPNKRGYVSDKPRFDEPDDINDPKWDEPLLDVMVKEERRNRKCANCGDAFVRLKTSDPMMLCPTCSKKLEDSFNDSNEDFTYAAEEERAAVSAATIKRSEKHRILNIKPL